MCAREQIGWGLLFNVHLGSTLKRGHTMKYSILLAAITALSLSACNKTETTAPATDVAPATPPAVTEPAAPAAAPADTMTPPPADTTTPPADTTAPAGTGTTPAGTTPPAGGTTTQ
jgi:hypothetical protein